MVGEVQEVKFYSLKDWVFIIFLGLLGTYIYYLFLYLGYAQAEGLEVLVIQYTWPILIVVLSAFILREKLTYRKIIAIALGFLGVMTVLSKGELGQINVSNPSVILLVGAGAFCFALFSVLSKTVKKSPTVVVSLYFLTALIASFLSMLFFSKFQMPTSAEIIPILLNGVLVNGYSYIFWKKALHATEASYLAPFTYIAPILSAVYLVIIFGEPFLMAYAIGLILIVAGGLVNSTSKF
jgi:drug/metabolite transporter (DMT)-like permease